MPPQKDEKKDKPKVVAEKTSDKKDSGAKAQPAGQQAQASSPKKIELTLPTLSLEMGPNFVMKLVLLGLLAIIFVFALVLFTRTNFATIDTVDFARLQYNLPKLWGLWFVVFAIVFSLALALAVLHGFKASRLQSGFPLVFLFLIAAVAGVVFPSFSLAFYAFALCLGIASAEASFHQELSLSSIWKIAGRALFALMVLSLVFSYAKFSSNSEVYFNSMLGSVTSAVPDLVSSSAGSVGKQALDLCAGAVEAVPVTREMVEGAVSKESIAAAVEATGNPLYTALPSSTKQSIVNSMYASAVSQSLSLTANLKSVFAGEMRKIDVEKQLKQSDIAAQLTPTEIRKVMEKLPGFKQVQDTFPIVAAMTVMSLVTIVNFFLRIFSTVFVWALNKVI